MPRKGERTTKQKETVRIPKNPRRRWQQEKRRRKRKK